jgi:hypothetical protein
MASATLPTTDAAADRPARRWLVGPWFDALFVANAAWPLFVLAQADDGFSGKAGLQFWQLYYVTTPHRWITLLIVFLDRGRLSERLGTFMALAAAALVFCLGVRLTTGALTCLLAIDYVWNAWHFAAQHHGIYRIYGRLGGPAAPPPSGSEKVVMRGFLLYVILRVATATWPSSAWQRAFGASDVAVALLPAWLIGRELLCSGFRLPGRLAYLISVSALYLALLGAVHQQRHGLVLALATASALFHAIEYLTLVSWSVRGRHAADGEKMGLLGVLVPRWGIALGVFVVVLGAGGWLMDQWFIELWLFLNVVAAFLHYAYDGLIWRQRAAS